jgi:hypothetical protein
MNPRFKEMINIASHAIQGVKIPGQKATHVEIMRMFKNHSTKLKAKVNVCATLYWIVSLPNTHHTE